MTVWFTSDTHFFHRNIIRYSGRPFTSVEEMNEQMIERWNRNVKPSETIYHLGDFGFAPPKQLEDVLKRLNGKKVLIIGNHDKQMFKPTIRPFFQEMTHYKEIYIRNKQRVVLSHYPFASWNGSYHGSFCFHGHTHGTYVGVGNIVDVGVDCWNFKPVSYDELESHLSKKKVSSPIIKEKEYSQRNL